MPKRIAPVQTPEELAYIGQQQNDVYFLPLTLDTLLCCISKQIRFFDPADYLDNSFHTVAIQSSKKFSAMLPVFSKYLALQAEIVAVARFFYHQILFLQQILNRIIQQDRIDVIVVSGWASKTKALYSHENYVTSEIVQSLFPDRTISLRTIEETARAPSYRFELSRQSSSDVLLLSYGYNFDRLAKSCEHYQLKHAGVCFERVSIKQRFGRSLRSRYFNEINSIPTDYVNHLRGKCHDNPVIDLLVNNRLAQAAPHIQTLFNKCEVIDTLLEGNRFRFTAGFVMRGIDGYLLERSHELGIPSIAISHGTIAPSFDENDKIYKSIIAEAVFSGKSTYVALQSKIAQSALATHEVRGRPIVTGNLIFSAVTRKQKKHILYAVTLKDFCSLQYFGVEMYYEFFSNLSRLVEVRETVGLPIVVQLHPSARGSKESLQRLFPTLKFSTGKVTDCLRNALTTLSYSSTVIEDSLCCAVPVILFDQWYRYKHCQAEPDPSSPNKAVYIVNNVADLIRAISTISLSSSINFQDYMIPGDPRSNFRSLLKELL